MATLELEPLGLTQINDAFLLNVMGFEDVAALAVLKQNPVVAAALTDMANAALIAGDNHRVQNDPIVQQRALAIYHMDAHARDSLCRMLAAMSQSNPLRLVTNGPCLAEVVQFCGRGDVLQKLALVTLEPLPFIEAYPRPTAANLAKITKIFHGLLLGMMPQPIYRRYAIRTDVGTVVAPIKLPADADPAMLPAYFDRALELSSQVDDADAAA